MTQDKSILKQLRREEADRLSNYLLSDEWADKVRELFESSRKISGPPRTSLEAAADHEDRLNKLDELIDNLYSRVSLLEKLVLNKGENE